MTDSKLSRFATPKQIPEFYPCFKIGNVRNLIFNEEKNGMSCCIYRMGKKILINLDQFDAWINSNPSCK